jgi:hypothetical protein
MKRASLAAAFTLAETAVASAVCSVALAALAVGSISLQRGLSAAEYHVGCQEDQLRVLDYIGRDVRRASSAVVSDQNRKLTLTLPGYKATPGSTGPSVPALINGLVKYPEPPITVAYYISGVSFIRREGATETVLSTNLEQFYAFETNRPQIELRLNFVPRFSRNASAAARAATQARAIVCLRNVEGGLQ